MYTEPKAFASLMDMLADMTVSYLLGQAEAGAHCLMLFDSWVGALSRHDFERYVLPHSKKIFAALGKTRPSIYFGTGCGGMLDLMAQGGSTALGVDWRSDIKQARAVIGLDIPVMGNLDPCVLFADRDTIKSQTDLIMQAMHGERGHIFNLGHGILQHTPEDNVKYLVETVKNWTPSKVGV